MSKEKICGIYKFTNPKGEHYIGQSRNINRRLYCYKRYGSKGSWKLHRSLVRHGYDNHTKEIVRICKESQLNFWERYYEKFYQSWNTPWGLNIKECGDGYGTPCDETREKMRKSASGPFSEERKAKHKVTRKINCTDKPTKEQIEKAVLTAKANGKHKGLWPKERKVKAALTRKINCTDKPSRESIAKQIKTKKAKREKIKALIVPKILLTQEEKNKKTGEASKLAWEIRRKNGTTKIGSWSQDRKDRYCEIKRKKGKIKIGPQTQEHKDKIVATRKANGSYKKKPESIVKGIATKKYNREKKKLLLPHKKPKEYKRTEEQRKNISEGAKGPHSEERKAKYKKTMIANKEKRFFCSFERKVKSLNQKLIHFENSMMIF